MCQTVQLCLASHGESVVTVLFNWKNRGIRNTRMDHSSHPDYYAYEREIPEEGKHVLISIMKYLSMKNLSVVWFIGGSQCVLD